MQTVSLIGKVVVTGWNGERRTAAVWDSQGRVFTSYDYGAPIMTGAVIGTSDLNISKTFGMPYVVIEGTTGKVYSVGEYGSIEQTKVLALSVIPQSVLGLYKIEVSIPGSDYVNFNLRVDGSIVNSGRVGPGLSWGAYLTLDQGTHNICAEVI